MGRPREFDLDAVLDAAQEAFWDHGYEGTSIQDLLEATGLQRGSLYKAFGDKHGLYLRTLERYQTAAVTEITSRLDHSDGAFAGLRLWLLSAAEGCKESQRRGCFVVNSTIELSPHDQAVAELTETHLKHLHGVVKASVTRAQTAGDLRSDLKADEITRHLILVAYGLAVDGRGGTSVSQRCRQADLALKLMR